MVNKASRLRSVVLLDMKDDEISWKLQYDESFWEEKSTDDVVRKGNLNEMKRHQDQVNHRVASKYPNT